MPKKIITLVSLCVLVIIFSFLYYYPRKEKNNELLISPIQKVLDESKTIPIKSKQMGTTVASTTTTTDNYVYSNTLYGFHLNYPQAFGKIQAPEVLDTCSNSETWDNKMTHSTYLGYAKNLSISVICSTLETGEINQFTKEMGYEKKEILTRGEKDYTYSFVTATGYEWRIFQVPIDKTHYIELSYTYRNLPDYVALTETEWDQIISTISFE